MTRMALGPSAHVDSFARDNLPPAEQWPEIRLDGFAYPERLNAAVELTDRMVAQGFGDHVALIGNGRQRTYKELSDWTNRLAHALVDDLGVKRWLQERLARTELRRLPVSHIPYGIDLEAFSRKQGARQRLGLSEQAAREDPLSHYVQGARQIRDHLRSLAGDDPLRSGFVDIFIEPPSLDVVRQRLRT